MSLVKLLYITFIIECHWTSSRRIKLTFDTCSNILLVEKCRPLCHKDRQDWCSWIRQLEASNWSIIDTDHTCIPRRKWILSIWCVTHKTWEHFETFLARVTNKIQTIIYKPNCWRPWPNCFRYYQLVYLKIPTTIKDNWKISKRKKHEMFTNSMNKTY